MPQDKIGLGVSILDVYGRNGRLDSRVLEELASVEKPIRFPLPSSSQRPLDLVVIHPSAVCGLARLIQAEKTTANRRQ